MADQPETPTYEAGIFQWETTTPVRGGADGLANLPLRQLANRTAWLKAQVEAAQATAAAAVARAGDTMSGALTVNASVTATGFAATGAGAFLESRAPAGTQRALRYSSGTAARWEVGVTGAAESGGNAGSAFVVNRHSDAGAYLDTPFQISRQTGQVTLAAPLNLPAPQANGQAARRRDVGVEWLRSSPAITGNPEFLAFVLDAEFAAFEFEGIGLAPSAGDRDLVAQLSADGGATWFAGASDYFCGHHGVVPTGAVAAPVSATSAMLLTYGQSPSGVLAAVTLRLTMPATSGTHGFDTIFQGSDSTGSNSGRRFGNYVGGPRANRIRFAFLGGTFANQGVIIQRGIRA